jgi:hypothetical protein
MVRRRVSRLAAPLRCTHSQHFRGRGGNSGAGHCTAAALSGQLNQHCGVAFEVSNRSERAKRFLDERYHMQKVKIRQGDWVIVCDGKKALVLENTGDEKFLNLKTKEVHE